MQSISQVIYFLGAIVLKGYSAAVQNAVSLFRNLVAIREKQRKWLELALIVVAGEPLGRLLRLPSPAVLGPLLFTIALSVVLPTDLNIEPPTLFKVLAFMAIGWMCGGALNLTALKVFAKQLPATFLFIFALMAVCAAAAVLLTFWLDISYFEAYLATSPGALETVLALSSEGEAGPVVVTIQIIRLLAILAIAGWLPAILRLILRNRN